MGKYDVAIVGGGIAGLIASIYAAKAGKKTIVLEQQKQLGGRAITQRKNGAYFDLGGHALYKGDAVQILQELNVELAGKEPSSDAFGIWKNQLIPLPMNFMSLLTTPLFSFRGKREIGSWLVKLRKLDTSQYNQMSVRDWIEGHLKDPMVRNFFYSLLRTASYVVAPDLQAAGPVLRQLKHSMNGVLYLDKGWGALVKELRNKAEEFGVGFMTGNRVTEIETKDRRVEAVKCADGTRVYTDHVILTTAPEIAYKLVPYADQTSLQVWKDQAIPITAACLSIALRRLPKPKNQFIYGLDQAVFLSNQSRAAHLSDNGDQVVQLIKYQGTHTNVKIDEQDLEQTLDLAQPGWREKLVARQFLPRIVVTHDFMHMKRTVNPGPHVPEIKGLYVAGDWVTHGELLVDAAAASAKRAVEHLIAYPNQEGVFVGGHRVVV
ncbi:Phytoene dehydrogenase-related protein [Seinonella peptonophila]|uniref:Phytoene dehydrogenase-related protein n=1 Tax=Seinonella peptonophila TaxID=112248 RepID=A0A1M4U0F8_9BACL|nr:NAD(P)/FAD-dependent oxidoreductase [Seinonella peptonophila]SHE50170.1 Phytoene dehydrogenase-related protein [Seinonella peptonophila]